MSKEVGITLKGVKLDNITPDIDENMMKELLNDHELYLGFVRNFNLDIETVANLTRERDALKYLLQEYKDLEEQGLLLRLPCKVGDTLYIIEPRVYNYKKHEGVQKGICKGYELNDRYGWVVKVELEKGEKHTLYFYNFSKFGKTAFLTREEAEQKLKELEE